MVRSFILTSLALIFSEGSAHSKEQPQPIVGPKNGSFSHHGRGRKRQDLPQVFAHFIKLAGGKDARIVIVPTAASSSPDHNYQRSWSLDLAKSMGVQKAALLHSHDRETA
jgi:cyanophycinase